MLGALPHVGPSLVKKLVEQREVRPFASIEDLRRRVRGLGPATMARLAPHLRIAPGRDLIPDPGGCGGCIDSLGFRTGPGAGQDTASMSVGDEAAHELPSAETGLLEEWFSIR